MHLYFVGLDVHKQVIAFCVKTVEGGIVTEGVIPATRTALDEWVERLPGPWHGAIEATIFSHWIYEHLKPHAAKLEMGHAARMKAICAGKKKSDKLDARTIADLLRCNLFPDCFVISPELGALRQQLRFRRLVVEETVMFKNKTAGLLMSAGVEYERRRLHGKRYFESLLKDNEWIGQGTAASAGIQSRPDDDAAGDGPAAERHAGASSGAGIAGEGSVPDRRSGPGDGVELGTGSGHAGTFSFHQTRYELLRPDERLA